MTSHGLCASSFLFGVVVLASWRSITTKAEVAVVTKGVPLDSISEVVLKRHLNGTFLNVTVGKLPLEYCRFKNECMEGLTCSKNFCACPPKCSYKPDGCICTHIMFPFWYFIIAGLMQMCVAYYCTQECRRRMRNERRTYPEPTILIVPQHQLRPQERTAVAPTSPNRFGVDEKMAEGKRKPNTPPQQIEVAPFEQPPLPPIGQAGEQ